jgi:hypothetical protein
MLCFRYIIVNTLHTAGNEEDNNNNNSNNNRYVGLKAYAAGTHDFACSDLLINDVLSCYTIFDVVTSIVSFIWAPSTRGGVVYGVRTLSTNRNSY